MGVDVGVGVGAEEGVGVGVLITVAELGGVGLDGEVEAVGCGIGEGVEDLPKEKRLGLLEGDGSVLLGTMPSSA